MSNFLNLLIAPFRLVMVFAAGVSLWVKTARVVVSNSRPTFDYHVVHIRCLSTKPQVFWVNTRRVISTGAIVVNLKSFWDWTIVNLPRNAVRGEGFARPSLAAAKFSISKRVCAPLPNPTSIGLEDMFPEQFRKWCWFPPTRIPAIKSFACTDFETPSQELSTTTSANGRNTRMAAHRAIVA